MMDYSDTVIVVVTTISAAIVVVLLALLYYIKCVLSRPVETDKASDWMTNPSPTSKTSIKSPKGGSENGEYIMNPSVSLRNSEKAKALSVDVETGAKTNSTPAVQPKSASKRFLDPVSIVASIMGRSQPSPAAASPAASSSARKSDGFGSFHFLDPAFASVVKGAKVEEAGLGLDTVLPLPQLSSAATATGSAVKKDQSSSPLPPPPEVAVKEATALTWSLDALPSQQSAPATSVSEPTPAPIIPDSIKQDLTPIEDFSSDPAGASAPAGETDGEAAAPVLSENEFDEAMTSKLMPPSASGPQKFSSDGLMPVDVQMSLAANKNLTAAERNTEYFKKMKEHESMADQMRVAKMDPQQLLNKKIEMELKRAHENKKSSHTARLGTMSLKGQSLSMSRSVRLQSSTSLTPRERSTVSIPEDVEAGVEE